jgi:hypothetical protein
VSGGSGADAAPAIDSAGGSVDAAAPDASSADAPLPDARPDAPLPDAPLLDAPLPDARLPDAPLPDAPLPDSRLIDSAPPDADLRIDAGVGAACGARGTAPCVGNVYCDWADDSCGATDTAGICTVRPDVCDATVDYVCACDGQVYANACLAAAAGTDVNGNGGCAAPPGLFACGPTYCSEGTQFCQKTEGGVPGSQPHYSCGAIPPACSPVTCACLRMSSCGTLCDEDASGNFTLTCEAP